MAHDDSVDHAEFLERELILPQLTETLVGLDGHVAAGGLQIPTQNFHERRLTAAVGADQAVTVAAAKFDGNVLKQGLGPKLHGDVGCRNQSRIPKSLRNRGGRRRLLAATKAGDLVMARAFSHKPWRSANLRLRQLQSHLRDAMYTP